VLANDANGRYFAPAAGRNLIAGINAAIDF
jgi:hypothetical protein